MTTNKNMVLAGAALTIVGLFCPIVTLPFLGNVNLFNNGSNLFALALLALAVLAGAMALNDREGDAFWPGATSAAVLAWNFASLQYHLAQVKSSMSELEGNPFAGVAKAAVGAVQLQWGWLVLSLGVGLLIYGGLKARRDRELGHMEFADGPAKTVAAVSLVVAVVTIGGSLLNSFGHGSPAADTKLETAALTSSTTLPTTEAEGPSAEEAAYIRTNLRLYDLQAKYYDSMLDGRIPGVDFKIKNLGNRTLNGVTVRVVFQDAEGKPIAEEEYNPVLVTENNFMGDNTPLRPNYIWQNEPDKFYQAKSVPSEWAEGKATATITDIEFAPK
ncbi:hypothetical protein [Sphingomonas arenae]|uniref:hypothetical protein n=1 Tax=Sphingomonas arenae TaxID=2812555 RepID=UPI0019673CED|nr:hypothetical protein [Sphingomonas arenae]